MKEFYEAFDTLTMWFPLYVITKRVKGIFRVHVLGSSPNGDGEFVFVTNKDMEQAFKEARALLSERREDIKKFYETIGQLS